MPIPARAGQTAQLDPEDDPDVVERDLGQQPLEPRPSYDGPPASPGPWRGGGGRTASGPTPGARGPAGGWTAARRRPPAAGGAGPGPCSCSTPWRRPVRAAPVRSGGPPAT